MPSLRQLDTAIVEQREMGIPGDFPGIAIGIRK